MKHHSHIVLLWLLLTVPIFGTQPTLTSVTQPLYYLSSAIENPPIQYIAVPKINKGNGVEAWVSLFTSPTKVEGGSVDLNLISRYGIDIKVVKQDKDGSVREIVVDISKAKKPNGYPFSIQDVGRAATKAVRMEFKDKSTTKILLTK